MEDLKKRKGYIDCVSGLILNTLNLDELKLFYGNFYIINIEHRSFDIIRYFGFSEHFEVCKYECEMNQYTATFDREKKTIAFKKQD